MSAPRSGRRDLGRRADPRDRDRGEDRGDQGRSARGGRAFRGGDAARGRGAARGSRSGPRRVPAIGLERVGRGGPACGSRPGSRRPVRVRAPGPRLAAAGARGRLGEARLLRLRHDDACRAGHLGGCARGCGGGVDGRRPRRRGRALRLRVYQAAGPPRDAGTPSAARAISTTPRSRQPLSRRSSTARSRCSTSTRTTGTARRRSSATAPTCSPARSTSTRAPAGSRTSSASPTRTTRRTATCRWLRAGATSRGSSAVAELAAWARSFGVSGLVVALGVDAAAADPESPLQVSAAGYREAGRLLGALGVPTVVVQEGGYDLELARRARPRVAARARGGARVIEFSPEYLRHVVERLASIGSHPLGFRVAGTPEEREAVDFIAGEMRSLGLENVVEEPVPVDGWRLEEAFVELADGIAGRVRVLRRRSRDRGEGRRGRARRASAAAAAGSSTGSTSRGKIALVEWQVARLWPYHVGPRARPARGHGDGALRARGRAVLPGAGSARHVRRDLARGGAAVRDDPASEDAPKLDGRGSGARRPACAAASRAPGCERRRRAARPAPRALRRSSPATTTAGSARRSTTRPASRSRSSWRARSPRRASARSARSRSSRTPPRSTASPSRPTTGVTAPGTRSSPSIASGRPARPSTSTSRARAGRGRFFTLDVPPELAAWIRRHCRAAAARRPASARLRARPSEHVDRGLAVPRRRDPGDQRLDVHSTSSSAPSTTRSSTRPRGSTSATSRS